MSHYRLLRDNKESGPFSEEEMIAKGFKPYDLIWVEGKSAGWRYPSEIAAFKNFAPVVEEQPYDRFYKKQAPQKLFVADEKDNASSYHTAFLKKVDYTSVVQPSAFIHQQPLPDYSMKPVPGRHIHVTLPSGNTVNLTTVVAKKENKEADSTPAVNKSYTAPEIKQPVFNASAYSPAQAARESNIPIAIPVAVSNVQPAWAGQQQPAPYQPLAGFSWSLIAAAFIGIATLVGLGIMIGLAINREKNDIAFNEAIRHKSRQTSIVPAAVNSTKPAAVNALPAETPVIADEALQSKSSSPKNLVQNAVVKTVLPADSDLKATKKLPSEDMAPEKYAPPASREETVVHKPAPLINLEKNLSLTANDFKTGAFGGISGLKYTLVNGSKLPLESVEVEIDYILANKKVFKTVKLLFKDVSAGAQATIDAPSSNRGIKTSSRIIKINNRETGLSNPTAKS
ncbi:MAG: hypothetical protein ABIQ88_21750 [Chitinophagaceae bacterium]